MKIDKERFIKKKLNPQLEKAGLRWNEETDKLEIVQQDYVTDYVLDPPEMVNEFIEFVVDRKRMTQIHGEIMKQMQMQRHAVEHQKRQIDRKLN